MTITIIQDARGCDVVSINGEVASPAVTSVILEAMDRVETIQHHEATSAFEQSFVLGESSEDYGETD